LESNARGNQSTGISKRKNKSSNENGITKKQKKSPTRRTTEKSTAGSAPEDIGATPQTPRKKQDVTSIADNLILTPPRPPRLDRPVEPHRTNATLVTPRGSSVVAYPSVEDVSPSKTGLPRPTATTGNLLEKALEHLISVDARLKPVIEQHHCHLFSPEGLAEQIDPFDSLVSSIIGQQVSGAAARSIKNKFLDLFDKESDDMQADAPKTKRRFPTPAQVAKLDIPTLRTAGLSQRKAEYIQGLAEKFANGELSTQKLLRASDEEVMEMLIAVRGLGRWSVEMFSCFALKRTDVFSTGDLGVQYVYGPPFFTCLVMC
jgi:DNA-3-methyladenine glycosylase II